MQVHSERGSGRDGQRIQVASMRDVLEFAYPRGFYHAKCFEGGDRKKLKWEDDIENVITYVGKNDMENVYLKGNALTATIYMGLIGNTTWTNLNTTVASLSSYTSGTGIAAINTTIAHGLLPGDTVIIASVTGTGANINSCNGTWVCQAGTTASVLNIFVGYGLTITTLTGGTVTTTSATRINDTLSSHANWGEAGSAAPTYAARLPVSFSAAATGSITTSSAVSFTMTGAGTVNGCFLVSNGGSATNGNTTGTLFSAGAFTGGSKAVGNTDVVNVSYTYSM